MPQHQTPRGNQVNNLGEGTRGVPRTSRKEQEEFDRHNFALQQRNRQREREEQQEKNRRSYLTDQQRRNEDANKKWRKDRLENWEKDQKERERQGKPRRKPPKFFNQPPAPRFQKPGKAQPVKPLPRIA